MIDNLEDRIRARAHGIWEREGQPVGRAEAHWFRAAEEVMAEATKAARRKPARGTSTATVPPKARASRPKASLTA